MASNDAGIVVGLVGSIDARVRCCTVHSALTLCLIDARLCGVRFSKQAAENIGVRVRGEAHARMNVRMLINWWIDRLIAAASVDLHNGQR